MTAKKKAAKRGAKRTKATPHKQGPDVRNALVMARREGYLVACREPVDGGGVCGCAAMVNAGSCQYCEAAAARHFPLAVVRRGQ